MNQKNNDIAQNFKDLKLKRPDLFAGIETPIVSLIAEGDGMYNPEQSEYYALCGLNALQNILYALKITKKSKNGVANILDFACGYGRVARVLNAAFPQAKLTVCDADPKAVDAVKSILSVEGIVGELDLDNFELDKRFDLIWVGSLFTHINSEYANTVLDFLVRHLSEGGTVVFSTHGPYVANRINTREKTYGLDEISIDGCLQNYDELGYGFSSYPGQTGYGISITKPSYMSQLIESRPEIQQTLYIERGWVEHQDVMAFTKIK